MDNPPDQPGFVSKGDTSSKTPSEALDGLSEAVECVRRILKGGELLHKFRSNPEVAIRIFKTVGEISREIFRLLPLSSVLTTWKESLLYALYALLSWPSTHRIANQRRLRETDILKDMSAAIRVSREFRIFTLDYSFFRVIQQRDGNVIPYTGQLAPTNEIFYCFVLSDTILRIIAADSFGETELAVIRANLTERPRYATAACQNTSFLEYIGGYEEWREKN